MPKLRFPNPRMRLAQRLLILLSVAIVITVPLARVVAQQVRGGRVAVDPDDIGGVVTSSKGPEAGVWVIAETNDLPTKFVRIVVTDDQGRYVVPDLPSANYQVFIRGYGLLDSARQSAKPGQQLNIQAQVAPDARAAAQVYPAAWWLSMIKLPDDKKVQRKFILDVVNCFSCHQVGDKATRELWTNSAPGASSTLEAWDRRTKLGPSSPNMGAAFAALGEQRKLFADWTDRIAKGEAPKIAPPRPTGVERNLVITEWDWGTPTDGRSDNAASDSRNPRVNANGKVYGASAMTDIMTVLDPVTNKTEIVKIPSYGPRLTEGGSASPTPSPYWGPDVWKRFADPRSVVIDGKARVWLVFRNRKDPKQPSFCTEGPNKFASFYPLRPTIDQNGNAHQANLYDPKTGQWSNLDTCFPADHNEMGADDLIYFGMNGGVGWVDVNAWDKTHDAEASQGWCQGVVDTNLDGKITAPWTEPEQPVDPAKDHRIDFNCAEITVNQKDGSLWCSVAPGRRRDQSRLTRIEKGKNPPQSCKAEFFEPPPNQPMEVFASGGVTSDSHGVVWQNWRGSGHFAAFDRSKCKTTNDPKATGQSCPEGWTFYRKNDPTFENSVLHANESYLSHMDYHDVLSLGKDAPMYGSVNTDAFEVLSPKTKQFVTLRIPYPMGFYPKSANGRIDDPKAGWKGKGLWTDYATYTGWHVEGGKGVLPKVVKLQMRPDPLAK